MTDLRAAAEAARDERPGSSFADEPWMLHEKYCSRESRAAHSRTLACTPLQVAFIAAASLERILGLLDAVGELATENAQLRAKNSLLGSLAWALERADRHGNLDGDLEEAWMEYERQRQRAAAGEETR